MSQETLTRRVIAQEYFVCHWEAKFTDKSAEITISSTLHAPHEHGTPCTQGSVHCSSSRIPVPQQVPELSLYHGLRPDYSHDRELDFVDQCAGQSVYQELGFADQSLCRARGSPSRKKLNRSRTTSDPDASVSVNAQPRCNTCRKSIRASSAGPIVQHIGDVYDADEHTNGSRDLLNRSSDRSKLDTSPGNQRSDSSGRDHDQIPLESTTSLRASHDLEQTLPQARLPDGDDEEPRNGRIAWFHAWSAFFVVANCWGLGLCWGLFQAYYEIAYLSGVSPSSIAWIGSTQLALVFGLGFPVGKLVDMGYFHIVFRTGSFLMVLGIFCTAWCTSLATLWVCQGLLTGVGMGMLFCSGITAMMTWFDEKKISIAMGLAAAGSCIGGIVYILLVRFLLVHQGFATTMRILGSVAAVTMIPANFVFRVRGERNKKKRAKVRQQPTHPFDWRTLIEPAYAFAAAGLFFAFMGVYFGFTYMVLYGSTVLHLSNEAATNLLIFMLAANLPGRFLPALISDNCIGPLNTIIPSAFLSSAVIWLWAASDNNRASLTVIACFYGFVSAGIQVLYISTVYSFCMDPEPADEEIERYGDISSARTNETNLETDRIGMRAGGLFTSIGLACLVGTPIGGALVSYRTQRGMPHPYLGAQIFAGLSLFIGGMLLLASRVSKIGWQAKRA